MCHCDTIYLHLVAEKTAFVTNVLPAAMDGYNLLRQQQSAKGSFLFT